MEELIRDIVNAIQAANQGNESVSLDKNSASINAASLSQSSAPKVDLDKIIHAHNRGISANQKPFSKKRLAAFYNKTKLNNPNLWHSWNIDEQTDQQLTALLQVKPRRSASGVATITVMAKPWPCGNHCLYCPNDIRMPKSYLSDEPVCQRAERNWFDPYLQVTGRLRALTQMGHVTDKVELIILGGTWCDYSPDYQRWFVHELFRALNDSDTNLAEVNARALRNRYKATGISCDKQEIIEQTRSIQNAIYAHECDYDTAFKQVYASSAQWRALSDTQKATWEQVEQQQRINETAKHRVVGLVMETRPETIVPQTLINMRRLGATKVQIGIQSLNSSILEANTRSTTRKDIQRAFGLLRLFGFKIHAHFMVNLLGATPEADKDDYQTFVSDPHYLPDEIKLYPCALVQGTELCTFYDSGAWVPYTEEELLDVLITDVFNTPPYVRISRMIRDISAHDIVAGNKKANLRQLVENSMDDRRIAISEIRHREISTHTIPIEQLRLDCVEYSTSVSNEYFLQWVTPEYRIAGFLRLSLPKQESIEACHELYGEAFPISAGQAMIREVHVYGSAAGIHKTGSGVQHFGLGKKLIARACEISQQAGFAEINVISSVGTRNYYRSLGFTDAGLYQVKQLS